MFNKKFSLTLISLTLSDHKIPVGQSIAITVKNMREYGFLRTRFFPYKSGNVDSVLTRKNTGQWKLALPDILRSIYLLVLLEPL